MKKILIIAISIVLLQSCSKDNNELSPSVLISSSEDFTDDRDNNIYKTIKIGDQVWMTENLRYRLPKGSLEGCYTYGEANIVLTQLSINRTAWRDSILASIDKGEIVDPPGASPTTGPVNILKTRVNLFTPSVMIQQMAVYPVIFSVLNRINNNLLIPVSEEQAIKNLTNADNLHENYSKNYGLLYTFESAQKVVPQGWRLPTDDDWKTLESNLGISSSEIDKLNTWRSNKSSNFLAFNTETVGFNAQLGGARVYGSFGIGTPFMNKDVAGYFWTSTLVLNADETELAIIREFMRNKSGVWRGTSRKEAAYHIRLIKKN